MKYTRALSTLVIVLGGLVMLCLSAWVAGGMVSVAGIETPKYEVVTETNEYEIRQYAPHIVAEVTVEGDFSDAMNRGFRKLADYIFGNNTTARPDAGKQSEEIAMTAPVLERTADSAAIAMTAPVLEQTEPSGAHVVSFVMPSEYTLDSLPRPNNAEVRLVEVPAQRYAVLKFAGTVSAEKAANMKQRLLEKLQADGVETRGAPLLAQYNPPWTPPSMRRNEVLIPVL